MYLAVDVQLSLFGYPFIVPKTSKSNMMIKMFSEKMLYSASKPIIGTYVDAMLKMDIQMDMQFPKGAKIIAANHPSSSDPFFVAAMLRQQAFILINELLFQVPFFGEYLRRSGHIPVGAGNGQAAIQAALEHLEAGHTIMIFPEGGLSPFDGGFLKAHTGVARLALMSGVPVFPVGIHLQRERTHSIRSIIHGQEEYGRWYLRGPYNMTVGKPLHFTGDVEDRPFVCTVAENVMRHIISLVSESEKRLNQSPGALAGSFPAF
jgi:1-acyl-sn-glycerol-3-phosphate acyltransferase